MYQVENAGHLLEGGKKLLSRRFGKPAVSRTVLLLGLTSMFTDISSEMVSTILPLYLVFGLGLTPIQFGVIDGLYQGAAALMRVASGFASDRWRRHKEIAALGYGLSAICRLGLLAVGNSYAAIAGIVLLDRTGKGIRTAPRDALISLSTSRDRLATAFGVHRTLDTAGAMLGPLLAFGLLAFVPGAYDAVFVVSFCLALIGLGILVLFVENRPIVGYAPRTSQPISLRTALDLLRAPRFRTLVLIGGALSLATISDGFLYLGLQRRLEFSIGFLPLLYVGTALIYMVLSLPIGRLADRIGRAKVFIGGYALLLLVYTSLLLPGGGLPGLAVYLLLFGAYYAATEGVLMALASSILPEELRGSGLALLVTATNLARLLASLLFGALWTWRGIEAAAVTFGVALVVAASVGAAMLARTAETATDG